MVQDKIRKLLKEAIVRVAGEEGWDLSLLPALLLEEPRDPAHGDLSSNVALTASKVVKKPPRTIAERVVAAMSPPPGCLEKIEIAGPGFLNFSIGNPLLQEAVREVVLQGKQFGRSQIEDSMKINIEFVSANPTGPLNVVNARAAVVGDVLANLLEATGHQVSREYYVNDVGSQVLRLGDSIEARYRELLGQEAIIPEDGYRGEYVVDLARKIKDRYGERLPFPESEVTRELSRYGVREIVSQQREILEEYGVRYNEWFFQSTLTDQDLSGILESLSERNLAYQKDGAVWLQATALGDEKDRVLVRSAGSARDSRGGGIQVMEAGEGEGAGPTYFAWDLAYHMNKIQRGFDLLMNLWGPDHHGYIPRMKAGMRALGYPPEKLEVLIVQLVTLVEEGKPVRMSKRAGEFITMEELLREVKRDAARFFFLTRHRDSPLEFDIALARKETEENPLYYVQYAHARICSILRNAQEAGVVLLRPESVDCSPLQHPNERRLIMKLSWFPEIVRGSALAREPHHLTRYACEVAAAFHAFYTTCRVLGETEGEVVAPGEDLEDLEDPAEGRAARGGAAAGRRAGTGRVESAKGGATHARLLLIQAVRQTICNILALIGVGAPERM